MGTIRILSLDGGGSRVGIHARTLGKLYGLKTPGRDIIRKFDFVAGNSGGSIVLTALCCNYTPEEIDDLYNDADVLRRMFSPKWSADIPLLKYILPRYSSSGKFESLKWVFDRKRQDGEPVPSTIPMEQWPTLLGKDVNLLVTAFDYDQERAAFFRSNTKSRAKSSATGKSSTTGTSNATGVKPTLVEAVHASTNAPFPYFDEPAKFSDHRYWDGAMGGYNNPVLAAVIEAFANRAESAEDFRVLSIGSGTSMRPDAREAAPPLGKARDDTGLISTVKKAATAILGDPPDAATFHAYVSLRQPLPIAKEGGSQGNVVRLCPLVRPLWDPVKAEWQLPKGLCSADFEGLIDMPLDVIEPAAIQLTRKMCDLWFADAIPNQPIRMGDHMKCDIGHDKFSEAAAHWKRISA